MQYKVSMVDLARQVFGIGYLPSYFSSPGLPSDFPTVQILDVDTAAGTSLLGTALFDVVEFYDAQENLVLSLKDAPIVSVSRPRNIVKTAIQGRDGTVKEFISNDDYKISVSGLLAHKEDMMPLEAMEELITFLNKNTAFRIKSVLLSRFDITHVVVDNIGEIKPVDGFTNLVQYSFTMLSDDAPEISI